MFGLLVPPHVQALPLYVGLASIGMLDTYAALIVPSTISVFAIFLFRQFFRSLPDDLIHAARLDGMSEGAIVWRVALPNAWPAATAFAIFSVVQHWNDLFWPLIAVNGHEHATPALGVMYFRTDEAGRRLRRPHGRLHDHDGAPHPRLPLRAAALRGRHRHHRPQGLKP